MTRPLLPVALALAAGLAAAAPRPDDPPVTLEVRAFDGELEVTRDTRVRLYPAGERDRPLPPVHSDGAPRFEVPAGRYDIQAIREDRGRVVGIRGIQGILAAHYAGARGQHLEVVNFRQEYGALQVWANTEAGCRLPDARLHAPGGPPAGIPPGLGVHYVLFIVPEGTYELVTPGGSAAPPTRVSVNVPSGRTYRLTAVC